jgi:hypothetical protein
MRRKGPGRYRQNLRLASRISKAFLTCTQSFGAFFWDDRVVGAAVYLAGEFWRFGHFAGLGSFRYNEHHHGHFS